MCSGLQANVFCLPPGATKSVSFLPKGRGDVSGSSPPFLPQEEMDDKAFCPLKKAVLGLVLLFEGQKKGETGLIQGMTFLYLTISSSHSDCIDGDDEGHEEENKK